jgi:outer membrane protein assembly factor BamE (lipoprotein component of BamABCDE complex)
MKYILSLVLIFAIFGCANSSKISEVQIGMTKNQVVEVMGKPVSISAMNGTEYLNYKLSETDNDAYYGFTSPYYVRLINGKVDSFGRMGDFNSTKTPTVKIEKDENINVQGNNDLYTELHKLKELRDEGILSEEEYGIQKKKVMEQQ